MYKEAYFNLVETHKSIEIVRYKKARREEEIEEGERAYCEKAGINRPKIVRKRVNDAKDADSYLNQYEDDYNGLCKEVERLSAYLNGLVAYNILEEYYES